MRPLANQFLLVLLTCAVGCHHGLEPPLVEAAWKGNTHEVRRLVLAGANVDARGLFGISALGNAAIAGHLDVVVFLLDHGADIEARDEEGRTPLLMASDMTVVRELVRRGASLDATDIMARGVLQHAINVGIKQPDKAREMLEFFLAHGVDINSQDRKGWTVLDWAIFRARGHGDRGFAPLLLSHGAKARAFSLEESESQPTMPTNEAAGPGRNTQQSDGR